MRAFLNDGREIAGGVAEDEAAVRAARALRRRQGEVRFKDVAYKDLALKTRPEEETSSRFRMQRLSDFYYSWGAGAADFNHDGVLDIVAGPHIYFGPDYTAQREIYLALTSNPSNRTPTDAGCSSPPTSRATAGPTSSTRASRQPRRRAVRESERRSAALGQLPRRARTQQTEIAVLRDVDGDGKPELVYGAEGRVRYAKPDPANPTGAVDCAHRFRAVASRPPTDRRRRHQRRRPDRHRERLRLVGTAAGRQSAGAMDLSSAGVRPFGRTSHAGGSVMAVYDVNGDKLNDVVTVTAGARLGAGVVRAEARRAGQHLVRAAHDHGRLRHEERRRRHVLAAARVDLRRRRRRRDSRTSSSASATGRTGTLLDPDPYGDPVLYWYRTVRNPKAPGGAEFVPELIHNRSGVGSDVLRRGSEQGRRGSTS